jgi:hypothetical protein
VWVLALKWRSWRGQISLDDVDVDVAVELPDEFWDRMSCEACVERAMEGGVTRALTQPGVAQPETVHRPATVYV